MNDLIHPASIRALARLGWEIEYADLDQISPRATIRLRRSDRRWLFFTVDHLGRCSLERWQREISLGKRRRSHPQSPQVKDEFLGRFSYPSWRAGLESLSDYLKNNPAPGREVQIEGSLFQIPQTLEGGRMSLSGGSDGPTLPEGDSTRAERGKEEGRGAGGQAEEPVERPVTPRGSLV